MVEDTEAFRQAIRADISEALAEHRRLLEEWLVSHEVDRHLAYNQTVPRESSSKEGAMEVAAAEQGLTPIRTMTVSKSHSSHMPDVFDNPHVKNLQKKHKQRREGKKSWQEKVTEWAGLESGADIRKRDLGHLFIFERVADSVPFQTFCSFLILSNSIFIGIEVDVSMGRALQRPPADNPAFFATMNLVFCVLFCMEIVVRLLAYRLRFFCGMESNWNFFDLIMVLSSVIEELVGAGSNMSGVRILRVLRLVRTLRIIRVVNFFRDLRLMVCCIFNSLMSLSWALLLMVLTMYLFGIVFVQSAADHLRFLDLQAPIRELSESSAPSGHASPTLISDGFAAGLDEEMVGEQLWGELHLQYSSIPRSLFTLLMSISGGMDWYDAVRPLMSIHPIYALLFAGYVMFVLFGVLNVLSAVFVEHAFQVRDRDLLIQAETDRTQRFLTDMAELFKEADEDGTGQLTWDEMCEYLKDVRVSMYMASHQLDVSDISLMFKLLDSDGTGSVEMEEFVLGCFRLKGNARCLDMMRVFQTFDSVREQLRDVQRSLQDVQGQSLGSASSTVGGTSRSRIRLAADVKPQVPADSAQDCDA